MGLSHQVNIKKNSINHQIKAAEVRLIDEAGQNIGVMPLNEALKRAQDAGMDLVEMSAGGGVPVCKITDYNKYLYDQKAKFKKVKPKKSDLKEFKFGPNISEGDLRVRIDRGKSFLSDGDMVKYTVVFRGREVFYSELGKTKLKIIESELSDVAKVDNPPKLTGNMMSVTLIGKKK